MQFVAVTVTRSYEHVARQIQEQILRGDLAQGQKLPTERAMGERFGVSRGVVREAIKVLSTMGMVESRQGSGSYVRNNPIPSISRALTLSVTPEKESVLGLFEFREGLEMIAARLAATHGSKEDLQTIAVARAANQRAIAEDDWDGFSETDQDLHCAIADAAANPYLYAVFSAIRQMQRDIMDLLARHSGTLAVADLHHARIVAAIAARDPDEAARAMQEHMRYSATSARAVMEKAREPGRHEGNEQQR
ncbi:MAG: FadR family transcriptional regulator [Chloroflexota bacterium]|nr:FadR family transcriptional regulator [Chloroflexota bacterium]MDQ6906974.1 FadR family transcriptional regulator [Chloroflexota bacterium]